MNLPICPTCLDTKSIIVPPERPKHAEKRATQVVECPDCKGRGRLLPPEALEAAAKDAGELKGPIPWDALNDENRQFWLDIAEAAIWSFIDALPGDTNG